VSVCARESGIDPSGSNLLEIHGRKELHCRGSGVRKGVTLGREILAQKTLRRAFLNFPNSLKDKLVKAFRVAANLLA